MTKKLPFNAYAYPVATAVLAALFLTLLISIHMSPQGITFYEVPAILIPEIALFAGIIVCAIFHLIRNLRR